MRGDTWDEAQLSLLRKLWAEGETAHAIGAKLGGLSRSAVLGKIFRLRLGPAGAGKKKPAAQTTAAAQSSEPITRRRRSFRPPKPPNTKTDRTGKTLFELTNKCCRWPYRRPGTEMYFFCGAGGADLEGGVPYCARHMKRAYLVPPPRIVAPRRPASSAARGKVAGVA